MQDGLIIMWTTNSLQVHIVVYFAFVLSFLIGFLFDLEKDFKCLFLIFPSSRLLWSIYRSVFNRHEHIYCHDLRQ